MKTLSMYRMRSARLALTLAIALGAVALVGCGGGASGADLVTKRCEPCHADIASYTNRYTTLEDWQACMVRMQEYTDTISDDEAASIAQYLTEQNANA